MADQDKKIVLVVCGYGCHLDTPLKLYLDRVVRFIKENKQPIQMVIFCGGFTQQKSAPGVSEAMLMREYIYSNLEEIRPPAFWIYCEDRSYTSFQNIERAAEIIRTERLYNDCRIVIFCEATRSANIIMLARHFMLELVNNIDDITVETGSWERADPFKQVGNLIYNKLAITFPRLGLAERECRRRIRRAENI